MNDFTTEQTCDSQGMWVIDAVQAFNSCTKSSGRPGIIYDRMPDWVPRISGYGCDCWLLTLELNVAWIHSFVVH